MKKIISLILVCALMLPTFSCFALAEQTSVQNAVLLDGCAIWAEIVDGKVYVITAFDNGKTHYAVADRSGNDGNVYEAWVPAPNTFSIDGNDYANPQFWQDKLDILKNNPSILQESEIITHHYDETSISTYSTNAKGALEDMLEQIFGKPTFDELIEKDTTSYPGYTIDVKEMLTLDVRLKSSSVYAVGMAIGTLVAAFAAKIPAKYLDKGAKAIINGLNALGIIDAVRAIFNTSGTLEQYECTAVRTKYTAVNGNPGPFSQTSKGVYMVGLDDKNVSNSTTLEHVGNSFTPDESYYSNIQYLIDDAYWSYTHQ